jgi:aspartate 1-decarboxylase
MICTSLFRYGRSWKCSHPWAGTDAESKPILVIRNYFGIRMTLVSYEIDYCNEREITMQRTMCKGKIHRATVTQANLNYVGSITIDQNLLDAADIYPYEKVQVVNVTSGARLETYTIAGAPGSGVICLNGAAARFVAEGDIVIIMSYGQYDEQEIRSLQPHIVFVDAENRVAEIKHIAMIEMLPEIPEIHLEAVI